MLVLGLEGQPVARQRADEQIDLVRLERDVAVQQGVTLSERLEVGLAVDLKRGLDRDVPDVDVVDVGAIDTDAQHTVDESPLGVERFLHRRNGQACRSGRRASARGIAAPATPCLPVG